MRRLALTLLAALLAALLAGAGYLAVQWQRRPSLDAHRALTLPAASATSGVRVRFAGVSTLVFEDGDTAWMTDGFFTRPGLRQLLQPIAPDTARIDAALRRLGVARLAAVVPVHTHYDHALDSAVVAQRTGALLVGGESTLNIGRGAGLAPERLRQVRPGDTLQLGRFHLRFIASRHSPTPYSDGHTREAITTPLAPPAHVTDWREGDVWSLLVTHASGQRFLVQGSAGFVPGALAGQQADTVFLGTGTLGKKDAAYRAAYWHETVKTVGARRVIPIHWDDFTLPLDEPLRATPYLLDDLGLVIADLQARGRDAGVEIRLPPVFVPFEP